MDVDGNSADACATNGCATMSGAYAQVHRGVFLFSRITVPRAHSMVPVPTWRSMGEAGILLGALSATANMSSFGSARRVRTGGARFFWTGTLLCLGTSSASSL